MSLFAALYQISGELHDIYVFRKLKVEYWKNNLFDMPAYVLQITSIIINCVLTTKDFSLFFMIANQAVSLFAVLF